MSETIHTAIVFYCKVCNGLMFAAVNGEHIKDSARDIAQMIKEGYRMSEISVENVRSGPWCSCKIDDQQIPLPLEVLGETQ